MPTATVSLTCSDGRDMKPPSTSRLYCQAVSSTAKRCRFGAVPTFFTSTFTDSS
ncbi:MAG: hypothetical protein QM820_31160 [Minicystis sp.]